MSSLSRRQFVGSVASLAAGAAVGPWLGRVANAAVPGGRPRALVHILLRGGMDATLTTDPKLRGTAAAIVTNEAEHIAVLLGALGADPFGQVPDAFVTGKK